MHGVMQGASWQHLPRFAGAMLALLVGGRAGEPDDPDEADVLTASPAYRQRFAGRIGKWFLDRQAAGLMDMLTPWRAGRILDVGGGHGQYTHLLLERGYDVTVLGSTAGADTQIHDLVAEKRCRYVTGSLQRLPFADRSHDIVISFRLLTHMPAWRPFLGELTRVADKAVIFDFPSARSLNSAYPFFFWAKRAVEGNTTRPYCVFRDSDIEGTLGEAGFMKTGRRAQYFFPMVLHRALHLPRLSMGVERLCRASHATDVLGSPIILRAERRAAPREEHSRPA